MNQLNISILSALAFTASANAAVITYTSQAFTNATDVSTTGTLVTAFNLGSSDGYQGAATTAVTINGVTFAASTGGANNGVFADAGNIFFDSASFDSVATTITGVSAADADSLLDSVEFGPGAGNSLATLTGLTIGQAYEIQILDARNDGSNVDYGYALAAGGAEVYPLTDIARSATAPTITTGTFTADATTQDVHIGVSSFGNAMNLEAAAYQLRAVPEPSSAILLGLGGLSLILRRRK